MIETATAAADTLRRSRISIGLSQSKLSRLAHVSRFKIGAYELGAGSLTSDEVTRICDALRGESERLRNVLVPTPSSIVCTEGLDA